MTDQQLIIARFLQQSALYLGLTDAHTENTPASTAVSIPAFLMDRPQTAAADRIHQ